MYARGSKWTSKTRALLSVRCACASASARQVDAPTPLARELPKRRIGLADLGANTVRGVVVAAAVAARVARAHRLHQPQQ